MIMSTVIDIIKKQQTTIGVLVTVVFTISIFIYYYFTGIFI